jgi:hypothetical protein
MRVGNQYLTDSVSVCLGGLHDAVDLPCRVHRGGLPGDGIADELHIVLHRSALDLFEVESLRHIRSVAGHAADPRLMVRPLIGSLDPLYVIRAQNKIVLSALFDMPLERFAVPLCGRDSSNRKAHSPWNPIAIAMLLRGG